MIEDAVQGLIREITGAIPGENALGQLTALPRHRSKQGPHQSGPFCCSARRLYFAWVSTCTSGSWGGAHLRTLTPAGGVGRSRLGRFGNARGGRGGFHLHQADRLGFGLGRGATAAARARRLAAFSRAGCGRGLGFHLLQIGLAGRQVCQDGGGRRGDCAGSGARARLPFPVAGLLRRCGRCRGRLGRDARFR